MEDTKLSGWPQTFERSCIYIYIYIYMCVCVCVRHSAPPTNPRPRTWTWGSCCGSLRGWRTRGPPTSCPTGHITHGSGTAVTSKRRRTPRHMITLHRCCCCLLWGNHGDIWQPSLSDCIPTDVTNMRKHKLEDGDRLTHSSKRNIPRGRKRSNSFTWRKPRRSCNSPWTRSRGRTLIAFVQEP